MSEFCIGKIVNKNKGNVHIGDVNNSGGGSNGGQGERVAEKSRKWKLEHTLAVIGIVVAVAIGILTLLA